MEPKSVLVVSKYGDSLDVAWTLTQEGHRVRMCIEKASEREIGDGFVEKVSDWKAHTYNAELIIFDQIGYGADAHALRESGKKVIGGTPYTDQLETDRSFGQLEMKKHGIKILKYSEFQHFDAAVDHVRQNPGKYVIKPSGDVQDYKQLLFVGNEEDGSDVIRVLHAYAHTWGDDISQFQLQKRATGVEVGVGAFFNGTKFLHPVNVNFEHKKLFPGELGVSTGEMGTSMFWVTDNPIFEATLKKMEPALAREGYVGYIDINCIVNGNGVYPLEFTCRFGYPTICIQRAGITQPLGEVLWNMASGIDFQIKTRKGFQVGVLIVVPPFPYEDAKTFTVFSKDAVVVFKKDFRDGIHIQDIKMINNEWLITGSYGIALIVTGTGTTMKEAQKQAYARIQNILIPNMYYRTDIGDRWKDDHDKLWSWGYL